MKLDMELFRSILIKIEQLDPGSGIDIPSSDFSELGCDELLVYGHLKLLEEGGFIEGVEMSHSLGRAYNARRITWQGHEFLNTIRDENIWKKTLASLKKVSGSTSLDVIKAVAISFAQQQLGLSS